MADKKKPDQKAKPTRKVQGGKKKTELSMDDLGKVSGGAAKKLAIRDP